MQSAVEYLKKMHLEELMELKTEGDAKYAFMLKGKDGWVIEDRVRTGEELDLIVDEFACEFRGENDGHAPVNGKDFLAVMIQNYQLPDANTEPDYEALAEERREGVAATA